MKQNGLSGRTIDIYWKKNRLVWLIIIDYIIVIIENLPIKDNYLLDYYNIIISLRLNLYQLYSYDMLNKLIYLHILLISIILK